MKPLNCVSVILLTLLFNTLNGQGTYLLTHDTRLVGVEFVNFDPAANNQQIQFRKSKNSAIQTFTPDQCTEFRAPGKREFVSKQLPADSSKYFLEVFSTGTANLYALHAQSGIRYFIEESSGYYELQSTDSTGINFKKKLSDRFAPCPSAVNMLEYTQFKRKDLANLFNLYNNCERSGKVHFGIGFFAGWMETKYFLREGQLYSNTDGLTFQYNGTLLLGRNAVLQFGRKGVSLHTGLLGTNSKGTLTFTSTQEINYATYTIRKHTFTYNNFIVQVPLLFRYTYPNQHLRPFINAGPSITFNLINNAKLSPNLYDSWDNQQFDFPPFYLSLNLGMGAMYRLNNRQDFWFEMRLTGLSPSYSEKLKLSQYMFTFGVNIL